MSGIITFLLKNMALKFEKLQNRAVLGKKTNFYISKKTKCLIKAIFSAVV